MTSQKVGERKKERDLQHTGRVEFSILHLGTELVKYTNETKKKNPQNRQNGTETR